MKILPRKKARRSTPEQEFMTEALRLAAKGGRDVSPNPLVGAVLVRRGRIVARGYHRRFGGAHAEIECLSRYRGPLDGTTLYVTLEPCSHYGKTPPCAALLALTPIREIVVAAPDPNPLVAGKGIALLRKAGKKIRVGLLRAEADWLNRRYIRAITTGRPYVHVKIAQTLDGRIAVPGGRKRWITGPQSRRLVHGMRAACDAVLVGATTVHADDPRLNVRGVKGRDPDVIVLDGKLRISETARIFMTGRGRRVFVCTTAAALRQKGRKARRLLANGADVLPFAARHGRIPVEAVLQRLYAEQIGSILVEGGGEVFRDFVEAGCVDELSLFIAPWFAGGDLLTFGRSLSGVSMPTASSVIVLKTGGDVLLHALFD
jgi:diaminohydroxyphosphoribosylaminopyrimidine deaminase/5-amino-6-(5-phosphoribosylamino)uracil reductase